MSEQAKHTPGPWAVRECGGGKLEIMETRGRSIGLLGKEWTNADHGRVCVG